MKVYQYKDYDEYKRVQISGNKNKLDSCWARKDDIELLSDYIKYNIPSPKFGICHGTRNGKEQQWFREFLNIEVIGTEIAPTASQFPHTIQWDFHDVKDEWIGNVDFIYSNALDHSYKPSECLDTWMSCLKKDGCCVLEWTPEHDISTRLDPFGATEEEYEEMIKKKYKITDKLESVSHKIRCLFFIVQ